MPVYTFWGCIAGLVVSGVYVLWALTKTKTKPELGDASEIILAGLLGSGGVKLLVLALGPHEIGPLEAEDRGYLFVGSVAVLWVAGVTAGRVFLRARAP